jgi:membrane-anchored glycerophosphoryl diester phosphodiesterase (GDPDase)
MSERWKFQLKSGLIWGLIMSFLMYAVDTIDMSFRDAFLTRKNLFRILFFVITGIFLVGYFSWKKKIKSKNTPDLPHNNTIYK